MDSTVGLTCVDTDAFKGEGQDESGAKLLKPDDMP
jgi:hypothetical protein